MFRSWRDLLHGLAAWSVFIILFVAGLSPERVKYILIGTIWLTIIGAFVGALGYFQRCNARVHDGCRYLSPGRLEWLGFVLGSALSTFLLWTYYYLASVTLDADCPDIPNNSPASSQSAGSAC
jgi:hypothetical protein